MAHRRGGCLPGTWDLSRQDVLKQRLCFGDWLRKGAWKIARDPGVSDGRMTHPGSQEEGSSDETKYQVLKGKGDVSDRRELPEMDHAGTKGCQDSQGSNKDPRVHSKKPVQRVLHRLIIKKWDLHRLIL